MEYSVTKGEEDYYSIIFGGRTGYIKDTDVNVNSQISEFNEESEVTIEEPKAKTLVEELEVTTEESKDEASQEKIILDEDLVKEEKNIESINISDNVVNKVNNTMFSTIPNFFTTDRFF